MLSSAGLRQDLHPGVLGNLNTHRIKHQRQNLRFEATNHSEFKPSGLVRENVPDRVRSSVSKRARQEQGNIPKTNVSLLGAWRHVSATEQ